MSTVVHRFPGDNNEYVKHPDTVTCSYCNTSDVSESSTDSDSGADTGADRDAGAFSPNHYACAICHSDIPTADLAAAHAATYGHRIKYCAGCRQCRSEDHPGGNWNPGSERSEGTTGPGGAYVYGSYYGYVPADGDSPTARVAGDGNACTHVSNSCAHGNCVACSNCPHCFAPASGSDYWNGAGRVGD